MDFTLGARYHPHRVAKEERSTLMGWATQYIDALKSGQTVQFRPRGSSMSGKIESGQLCTVEPITPTTLLHKGMIVLCKVNGREYLHLIKAVSQEGDCQIQNNRGRINGWTKRKNIYGICVRVEK